MSDKSTARKSYHHGDLKRALIATAVELIDECGVHEFSLSAASRRLGVAASAPYAHFADRDDLLAAVAVHALESFGTELDALADKGLVAERRLAAISGAYVKFAGEHEALFRTLFEARLDKTRHVEIAVAERRIEDTFRDSVRQVVDSGDEASVELLAASVEAVAHGHATLLLDGRFGKGRKAIETASESAARSTAALLGGRRHVLG